MIRKAKFENFKGLKDVEITFDSRFTVLVGPNGTGKTSVLQGVEIAAEWFNEGFRQQQAMARYAGQDGVPGKWLNGSNNSPLIPFYRNNSKDPVKVALFDEHQNGYLVEYPEHATFPGGYRVYSDGKLLSPPVDDKAECPRFAPSARPQYDSANLTAPIVTQETPPEIKASGAGLAALLAYLKLRDDELFFRTEAELRSLIPLVQKIRVDEVINESTRQPVKRILFDSRSATHIPSSQMSDGTLYILALIVAVLGPHRPKTLLIDDIDMRLHPKAQYELVTLLKKFLAEFPDLQIIATSHSPYILDKLEPNEVLVTGLGDDGSVVIAPITDHPDFNRWKESMTPGEFWSHTGEEWLKNHKRSAPTS